MKKAGKYIALTGISCIAAGFLLTLVLFFGFHDEIIQHVDELSITPEDFEQYFHEDEYHKWFDVDDFDHYMNEKHKYREVEVQDYLMNEVPVNGNCGNREYHNDCEYRDSCEYYRSGECQNGCDYYGTGECPNNCEYYRNGGYHNNDAYHNNEEYHNNHNGYQHENENHNRHNNVV